MQEPGQKQSPTIQSVIGGLQLSKNLYGEVENWKPTCACNKRELLPNFVIIGIFAYSDKISRIFREKSHKLALQ
jgi:hypothetical protein